MSPLRVRVRVRPKACTALLHGPLRFGQSRRAQVMRDFPQFVDGLFQIVDVLWGLGFQAHLQIFRY